MKELPSKDVKSREGPTLASSPSHAKKYLGLVPTEPKVICDALSLFVVLIEHNQPIGTYHCLAGVDQRVQKLEHTELFFCFFSLHGMFPSANLTANSRMPAPMSFDSMQQNATKWF